MADQSCRKGDDTPSNMSEGKSIVANTKMADEVNRKTTPRRSRANSMSDIASVVDTGGEDGEDISQSPRRRSMSIDSTENLIPPNILPIPHGSENDTAIIDDAATPLVFSDTDAFVRGYIYNMYQSMPDFNFKVFLELLDQPDPATRQDVDQHWGDSALFPCIQSGRAQKVLRSMPIDGDGCLAMPADMDLDTFMHDKTVGASDGMRPSSTDASSMPTLGSTAVTKSDKKDREEYNINDFLEDGEAPDGDSGVTYAEAILSDLDEHPPYLMISDAMSRDPFEDLNDEFVSTPSTSNRRRSTSKPSGQHHDFLSSTAPQDRNLGGFTNNPLSSYTDNAGSTQELSTSTAAKSPMPDDPSQLDSMAPVTSGQSVTPVVKGSEQTVSVLAHDEPSESSVRQGVSSLPSKRLFEWLAGNNNDGNILPMKRNVTAGHQEATPVDTHDHHMVPSVESIKAMSPDARVHVENVKVIRPGIGTLTFNEPIDLSDDELLPNIAGKIVRLVGPEHIVMFDENIIPYTDSRRHPLVQPFTITPEYGNPLTWTSGPGITKLKGKSGPWIVTAGTQASMEEQRPSNVPPLAPKPADTNDQRRLLGNADMVSLLNVIKDNSHPDSFNLWMRRQLENSRDQSGGGGSSVIAMQQDEETGGVLTNTQNEQAVAGFASLRIPEPVQDTSLNFSDSDRFNQLVKEVEERKRELIQRGL